MGFACTHRRSAGSSERDVSEYIYNEWLYKWDHMEKLLHSDLADAQFLKILQSNYREAAGKSRRNKTFNFRAKRCCILVLLLPVLAELALIISWICNEKLYAGGDKLGLLSTLIFAAGLLLFLIPAKWASVHAYQEAWTRHQKFVLDTLCLMAGFLLSDGQFANQSQQDQKKLFVSSFLQLTQGNHTIFNQNIRDREKKLDDVLEKFKGPF